MYIPAHFAAPDRESLYAAIERYSFATLISPSPAGMVASHLPQLLDRPAASEPATLVGHVKMTFVPEGVMVSCGRNERLNTVPAPKLPPAYAVPYRVLPDKTNSPPG